MSAHPATAFLVQHFRPLFARIAAGAAQRENERALLHDAVGWLREARFGALRVPVEQGGWGASVEQLFDLLVELAAADSNATQSLRAHFSFIERVRAELPPDGQRPWLALAARGELVGSANTEAGNGAVGTLGTVLVPAGNGWRLDGEKAYCTGTLYADWIAVTARRAGHGPDDRVTVLVRAGAPGVARSDDWRGFGQRLTASGTTRLAGVAVDAGQVCVFPARGASTLTAVLQLFHIAGLAGIAQAIVRDAAAFVRARTRVYSHGSGATARGDPLVQQVVGELDAAAFSALACARDVARSLGDIDRHRREHGEVPESLIEDAELRAAKAQIAVTGTVLGAASRLFDVGGASALQEDLRLDRHWRNARTLASHNPWIYKARAIGDHMLNGTPPTYQWQVGGARAAADRGGV